MAREAGRTMDEIIKSVGMVTQIMAHISSASQKQSNKITAVGRTITQMESMTQQNAALVEQAAAATESLEQQARQLVEAAALFKLSAERARAVPVQFSREERRDRLHLPAPRPAPLI